jgi:hypothetical protein
VGRGERGLQKYKILKECHSKENLCKSEGNTEILFSFKNTGERATETYSEGALVERTTYPVSKISNLIQIFKKYDS